VSRRRATASRAPYATHVTDYAFESMPQAGGYHRRGVAVHSRFPGEGVAPLDRLVSVLAA
jgi:hypothetical protein